MAGKDDKALSPPPRLRSARIVDEITEYLRNLILDHELEPGTVLLQTEWSERLGVSRTPLREAFRLLESDGLVRISNGNRTVEVVQYSEEDLRDLYQLREMVDGLAARLLATRGVTASVTAELNELLDDMDAASTPFRSSAWFAAHTAFHVAIGSHCGNKRLLPLLSVVRSTSMALHTPMISNESPPEHLTEILEVSRAQHRDIVDKMVAGDGPGAERAARRHIVSTLRSDLISLATKREGGA